MSAPDFPFSRVLAEPPPGASTPPYVIGAMATPAYRRLAERLLMSCRVFGLPVALYEVPAVHRSISPAGCDDLRLTKPAFLQFLLRRYDRPILYLDADCVIVQPPARCAGFVGQRVDFAIFNWLATEHTETYYPVPKQVEAADGIHMTARRFYGFRHSIDAMSDTQLLCSGAVQWWADSVAASRLLRAWQGVIGRAPRSPDDKCLDLAFNNAPAGVPALRVAWLDKDYARVAWWIYVRPVIDHPDLPNPGTDFAALDALDGQPRIHADAVRPQRVQPVFPRDCLIDTEARTLLRLQDGAWRTVSSFDTPLWL